MEFEDVEGDNFVEDFFGSWNRQGESSSRTSSQEILRRETFYWDNWLCHISLVQIRKHSVEMRDEKIWGWRGKKAQAKKLPRTKINFIIYNSLLLDLYRFLSSDTKFQNVKKRKIFWGCWRSSLRDKNSSGWGLWEYQTEEAEKIYQKCFITKHDQIKCNLSSLYPIWSLSIGCKFMKFRD